MENEKKPSNEPSWSGVEKFFCDAGDRAGKDIGTAVVYRLAAYSGGIDRY